MDFTGLQKEFREHGAVVLRSVLSPAGVARCRQAYDEILRDWAARSGVAGLPSYSDAMAAKHDTEHACLPVLEACPSLARAARDVWGGGPQGSVWLYQHTTFRKTLADMERAGWGPVGDSGFHRDANSAPCEGLSLLNLWIPSESLSATAGPELPLFSHTHSALTSA